MRGVGPTSPPPHGGHLIDLMVDADRAATVREGAATWTSLTLDQRAICDLELLATGGFSPLTGFMGPDDHRSVVEDMRLSDGVLWPIPVTLAVSGGVAATIDIGDRIALRDQEGTLLAAMHVEHRWAPDREAEASRVFGSNDPHHPGVTHLLSAGGWYLGGPIEVLELPKHHDFADLRLTPSEVRARIEAIGWSKVVAFQTRNPIHRAHRELTLQAASQIGGGLLLHPVVGVTKPGDIDHFTRVRAYKAVLPRYPEGSAALALLPLAMRMAGPREALWHAIIRKNFGCTHLIVGRDHAGPGRDSHGEPFYKPYEAQDLLEQHSSEIGVEPVPFRELRYSEALDDYVTDGDPAFTSALTLSGSAMREMLASGRSLPEWFTFPEVSEVLQRRHPARTRQGLTIFFTGFSGAGKSTIANIVQMRLLEEGSRPVTLLDGDLVRRNLSSELGFSKEHRDLNVYRIGYVASEITKHGGAAICAPIAPYEAVRSEVRGMIQEHGGFVLVHVATPLEVCEQRDRKGLYAKARAGLIDAFTGISDPYESPTDADVTIDTSETSASHAADLILDHLRQKGYLST